MAAYAALVSLMNNIEQIMNHPHLSTSFDNKHIQPLLKKARSLLHFVETNNCGGGSKEAQDLEREIASAAHAAEDVIEFHIADQIHAGTSGTSLLCSFDLQQKTQDMNAVMKKAHEFKGNQGSGEEHQPTPVMEIGETAVVGLDDELNQLLHELTFSTRSSRQTISIVGMGGTGKTTLAKTIYDNKLIKYHFDIRAWATISQQHNAKETLSILLHGLNKSSNNDLGLELHKNLSGRRYLIILDDIWSVGAWDDISLFLPDNNNGSRIVLTTRLSNVAKDCGSSPFIKKFLDEDNSRKLFCEKAFKNEACPPKLHGVVEEIVKLCKGLALSIVVIGGLLLKSPRTIEYWKGVVNDIKSVSDSKQKQESLDVLSLSYTHLPPHLKPCFLYMGVFEEDSEIRVSNVVKLWVAEGFIKPNGSQVPEEIGEGYLKDLIDRNLILVGRLRKNGKIIRSCVIHDLLRDLCIKVAEEQKFFQKSMSDHSYHLIGNEHRLICRSLEYKEGQISLARSIMTRHITGQPGKQGLLRVLSNKDKYVSPTELYENVNLRYLAYIQHADPKGTKSVWELPSSISLLWNLQTLIIQKYWRSGIVVAPTEIWKMRQLRHVKCPSIHLPYNGHHEGLILENLRTLKKALNLELCNEVCKSIPNINTLCLVYDLDLLGYDESLMGYLCNLDRLHKLESLNMSFTSCLHKKLAFPNSLNKLSLAGCHLDCNDMKMIGSLPQLEVLKFGRQCVLEGKRWSPIDGQFLRLKFLKLNLKVKHWDADCSHYPVLEKLVLIGQYGLKEIPPGIGDIPTLQLIQVKNCTVSVTISALKIKEDQLNNGNDGLQIQVYVRELQLEDFKKRVESEGLSIDNIQLEIS